MPYKKGQPTLMSFLGSIPLDRGVGKKRLFGGPYIHLHDFCELLSFMYESGAILGQAMSNKLGILGKMLAVPWWAPEPMTMKLAQEMANERLNEFRNETGAEPDSFIKFIQLKELERRIGLPGLSALVSGDKRAMKALDKRIPMAEAALPINTFGLEGVGFGSCFPTLTKRMYDYDYENIMREWSEARIHGVAAPGNPPQESYEKREKNVLQVVAAYASKCYPELLDPLDLRGHLEKVKEEER